MAASRAFCHPVAVMVYAKIGIVQFRKSIWR